MTALDDIKDGGYPCGPDGARHTPFRYATAVDDGQEVGMLYTMQPAEEWLLVAIDDVVDLEEWR